MQLNLFTAKHKSKHIQIKGKLNESQIKTGKLTGKSENRKGKLKVEKANWQGKLKSAKAIWEGKLKAKMANWKKRDTSFLHFYVLYSTLLHLPSLGFHCIGGLNPGLYCDFGIGRQTL
jgi:hypothetical protein